MTLVMCLLTVVVVMMNMVMIQGTSRLCEEHCRDPANRSYQNAIPGCNCSHQFSKSISESVRIKKPSPDKTEISDDIPIEKEVSKLDSPQIYYIVNPKNVNIKIRKKRPLQRIISETNMRSMKYDHHDSDENPVNRMELVQQNRPLYLDIGMQSDSKSEKMKDFELTEDSLSDCLDLNILIYCRKNNSSTTTEKVINRDVLKKYENLSDSELIVAIKTKCSRPIDVVKKSLNDVRARRPKKENKNKTILPSEANILTPIYKYATPRHTNRHNHEEENEDEERDVTEYPEVSKLELDISKPIIDTPEEHSNTEKSNEYRNSEPVINNESDDFSYQYPYSAETRHDIENIGSSVETSIRTIKPNDRDSLPDFLPPHNYDKEISPDGDVNYAENFDTITPSWKKGETEGTSDETTRKDKSNGNRNAEPANNNKSDDFSYQYPYSVETRYDIENRRSNLENPIKTIKTNDGGSLPDSLHQRNYNKELSPDGNAENFDTITASSKTGETKGASNKTIRKDQSNGNRNAEPASNKKLDDFSSYQYPYDAETRYGIENVGSNVDISTKTIKTNDRDSLPSPSPSSNYNKELSPDGNVNYAENFVTITPSKTEETEDTSNETPRIDKSNENKEAEKTETNTKFDKKVFNQFSNSKTKDIKESSLKDQSNDNRHAEDAETNTKFDYESSNQFPYIGIKDKDQSNENKNAEEDEKDTKLDNGSSNQYPYGKIVTTKEDTHSRSDSKKGYNVGEITELDINNSPTECVLHADHEQNRNVGKEDEIAETYNDTAIRNENVTEYSREYLGSNKETSTKKLNITEGNNDHQSNNKELSPNVNAYQTKTEDAARGALQNISMKGTESDPSKSDETHASTSTTTSRNLEFVNYTTDAPSTTTYSPTKLPNLLSSNSSDNSTSSVITTAISRNTTNPQIGSKTIHHIKYVNDSITSDAEKDKPSIIKEPPYNATNFPSRNSTLFDESTNSTDLTDDFANNFNISKLQSEENSVEQYHEYSKSVTDTHSNQSEENITKTAKQVDSTTESERHAHDVTEDFLSQRNSEESSQTPIPNTETTPRPQYSEQEIKIPKIITAELENGTVNSRTDGYEIPPKYDFVSDENIDSTEVDLNTTELAPKSEIFGHIYLIFNKFAVPAKFTQDARGKIRLGLDGFSLCQHWLTDHHQSEFFAKLCKSQKQQPLVN